MWAWHKRRFISYKKAPNSSAIENISEKLMPEYISKARFFRARIRLRNFLEVEGPILSKFFFSAHDSLRVPMVFLSISMRSMRVSMSSLCISVSSLCISMCVLWGFLCLLCVFLCVLWGFLCLCLRQYFDAFHLSLWHFSLQPKKSKTRKKARFYSKHLREKCPSSKARTNLWTKAKSQKIVTQGYSALYNTPFSYKSSAWDLSPVAIEFDSCSERRVFLPPRRVETHGPKAYSCSPNAKPKVFIVAF